MGVLTDFVVADRSDAKRLGDEREKFDGLPAKGMDQVRMGTLNAILTGSEYDPSFMVEEASFAYTASEDGPWVQPIPDDMVRRLAVLTPTEIDHVGDEWFKTEEFEPTYSHWLRSDVSDFLTDLQKLAARAVEEEKALFMWTCL